MPFQKVSLPEISWARQALRLEVLAEDGVHQVEAEEADAPEADHAGEGQHHADDRVPPPSRVAEQLGERAQLRLAVALELALARRGLPALGLLEPQEDRDDQQGGDHPDQEHGPPGAADGARLFVAGPAPC